MSDNPAEKELKEEYEAYLKYMDKMDQEESDSGFLSSVADVAGKAMDVAQPVFNVIDIPESIVRTGVEAAFSPEREVLPEVGKQIGNIIESPFYGAAKAPSGSDILEAALPKSVGYDPTTLGGKALGAVTEMGIGVVNPFGLAAKSSKALAKAIRQPFYSAAERQAAKSISQYATRPILRQGAKPEDIGEFLVRNKLEGEMKNPANFFRKITGTFKKDKIVPDDVGALITQKGVKEAGLIGQKSEELTNMLSSLEKAHNIKSTYPAQVGFKVILDNIATKLSQTSGQSPDLKRIQEVINDSIKPFRKEEILRGKQTVTKNVMGDLEFSDVPEFVSRPVEIGLTELHELRKNIGKLISDRDFYKTPDMAMSAETEVLRDIYQELGNSIEESLKGLKVIKGKDTVVDAADLYRSTNSELKHLYDIKSMLEFTPNDALKQADLASMLVGGAAKGAAFGGAGLVGTLAGAPEYSMPAALAGGALGLGLSAAKKIEEATPEYLSSILRQMGDIAPLATGPTASGLGMMFKGDTGREPQSIDPMQIARARLPRTTEGLIQQKELVISKLAQANIPPEMIKAFTQALNEDPEAVSAIATQLAGQFPQLFEKSKYNTFDGIISDPDEAARAADQTSKRDDLDSIQKAKLINELNKNQRWLGE